MADPVLSALARGKRRILEGWTRGHFSDGRGRYCLIGSIAEHSTRSVALGVNGEAQAYLRDALATLDRWDSLAGFNDCKLVKRRHVLGLLDFASELRRIDLRGGK